MILLIAFLKDVKRPLCRIEILLFRSNVDVHLGRGGANCFFNLGSEEIACNIYLSFG